MTRLSALPSTREQARHALLLLGAPAPARLVIDVHRALFDGDLDMPGLAALLRSERRTAAPVVCHGLTADIGAAARAALDDPELVTALANDAPERAATAVRVAALDRTQQLFGVPPLPQQRTGG